MKWIAKIIFKNKFRRFILHDRKMVSYSISTRIDNETKGQNKQPERDQHTYDHIS